MAEYCIDGWGQYECEYENLHFQAHEVIVYKCKICLDYSERPLLNFESNKRAWKDKTKTSSQNEYFLLAAHFQYKCVCIGVYFESFLTVTKFSEILELKFVDVLIVLVVSILIFAGENFNSCTIWPIFIITHLIGITLFIFILNSFVPFSIQQQWICL